MDLDFEVDASGCGDCVQRAWEEEGGGGTGDGRREDLLRRWAQGEGPDQGAGTEVGKSLGSGHNYCMSGSSGHVLDFLSTHLIQPHCPCTMQSVSLIPPKILGAHLIIK